MAFEGFPPALIDFFTGLEADNSKAYWQAHKPVYETAVRGPLEELAAALEDEFGAAHLYRPYRDVRFSRDKRPYKENAAMSVGDAAGGGHYFSISADGLFLGGGYWHPARDQLERWRQAVDDPRTGKELQAVVDRLTAAGFPVMSEETLKTVPRGFDKNHPRADLLRIKDLTVGRTQDIEPWLHTAECLVVVRDGWRHIRTWVEWLGTHVGPSQEAQGHR